MSIVEFLPLLIRQAQGEIVHGLQHPLEVEGGMIDLQVSPLVCLDMDQMMTQILHDLLSLLLPEHMFLVWESQNFDYFSIKLLQELLPSLHVLVLITL